MTDEQIEALRAEIDDDREQVRELLAEELGGDPEDYRVDRAAADGGEQS
jgi:hypothetical protein